MIIIHFFPAMWAEFRGVHSVHMEAAATMRASKIDQRNDYAAPMMAILMSTDMNMLKKPITDNR